MVNVRGVGIAPRRIAHSLGDPQMLGTSRTWPHAECRLPAKLTTETITLASSGRSAPDQRAIVRWLNTAGSGWGLRDYFRSNRSRYWVPTDAVERRREVGLRRRDAFSEPLGRRSSKFEKASACVSEHSGKLWSSPFHRMPCICACRTCPFRNIARTKRHVAPSRTWDMSCLPSPRCSLPPLLAFRNLYYRSGNPKHVS